MARRFLHFPARGEYGGGSSAPARVTTLSSLTKEQKMKCNMGKGDRLFRAILGIVVLAAGLYFQSWWGLIGLVFLGTAMVRWCPGYVPLGINTAEKGD